MPKNAAKDAGPADLARRFEEAWNAHDMAAFAKLFSPNASFVTRFGNLWHGREEIATRHAQIHATVYGNSTTTGRVQDVEFIRDDVAVVHVRSLVDAGQDMPSNPRRFSVQFSYVAERIGGEWLIRAAQNVALTDPQTGRTLIEQ